jgi:hypothetical protein
MTAYVQAKSGLTEASGPTAVMFIAGTGRSGSTLLERLIGAYDGFWPVGEMRFVWERSFAHNQLCGCGQPFHSCPFWQAVSREAYNRESTDVGHVDANFRKDAIDRIRYAPFLLAGRRPVHVQRALRSYGEILEPLYDKIRQVSGARVIVDSSKDPTHGLVLSSLHGLSVHVVHLVRDPRAVVFSWGRKRRRPEIHWQEQDMPIERVRTSAGRWSMHNVLAELLSISASSYVRIRYEDFLKDPVSTMRKIMLPFSWVAEQQHSLDRSEIVLEPTHTVSGNPMRFNHGPLAMKVDDEWRTAMARSDRRLVEAITWPLMIRYGYPFGYGR